MSPYWKNDQTKKKLRVVAQVGRAPANQAQGSELKAPSTAKKIK
jgi:hypothetical protein